MATKQLTLGNFVKGDHILWFATTQALNKVTITLSDNKKRYFHASKESKSITPPLSQGHDTLVGDELTLTIDIPNSKEIKTWFNNTSILSPEGKTVGESFTLCAEDDIDDDYDDVQVSVIGWKKKGL